jgi:hypothetical protein
MGGCGGSFGRAGVRWLHVVRAQWRMVRAVRLRRRDQLGRSADNSDGLSAQPAIDDGISRGSAPGPPIWKPCAQPTGRLMKASISPLVDGRTASLTVSVAVGHSEVQMPKPDNRRCGHGDILSVWRYAPGPLR